MIKSKLVQYLMQLSKRSKIFLYGSISIRATKCQFVLEPRSFREMKKHSGRPIYIIAETELNTNDRDKLSMNNLRRKEPLEDYRRQ